MAGSSNAGVAKFFCGAPPPVWTGPAVYTGTCRGRGGSHISSEAYISTNRVAQWLAHGPLSFVGASSIPAVVSNFLAPPPRRGPPGKHCVGRTRGTCIRKTTTHGTQLKLVPPGSIPGLSPYASWCVARI